MEYANNGVARIAPTILDVDGSVFHGVVVVVVVVVVAVVVAL